MAGAARRCEDSRSPTTRSIGGLLLGVLLASSGCATYQVPPTAQALTEAQWKVCDEFARGEVTRLGDSVPAAFAKGFLIGFALDLSRAAAAVHYQYGAGDPDVRAALGEGSNGPVPAGSNPQSALLLLPWSLIGGPQLARDAARTNEDVYERAIRDCLAPVRLARELGPTNARVATSLEVLADCYMWQRKYAQAEPLRRQALAIWEAVFGPNDPRVATALEDYATVLRQLHRVAEADLLAGRADAIRAQLGWHKSPGLATVPADAVGARCDSPLTAAIFVICRSLRQGPTPQDTPGMSGP